MWQWKRAIYIWYTVGEHTTKNNRILYCTKIPLPHFEYSIFYFLFFWISKNSWNFMNFHKLSWALPRPKNVCSNSLRWWCFLVKSSYPCTRICQEIRWFQQAFEMPKFENFENFKRSFQIMKKNFQNRVF